LWTGPPTEGEDSSLSASNHTAAGPQARTGLKQFSSVFKSAKKETRRTVPFTKFCLKRLNMDCKTSKSNFVRQMNFKKYSIVKMWITALVIE
jgi:hypothetical protein